MFRDNKSLRRILAFLIAVLLFTSPVVYAGQDEKSVEKVDEVKTIDSGGKAETVDSIVSEDSTRKDAYQIFEVQSGDYIEKSALKNVELQYLRNDILTIDKSEGTFVQYLVSSGQQVKEGDPLVTYQIPSDNIGITEKKFLLEQNESAYEDNLLQRENEINENKQKMNSMENSSIEAQILQLNIRKMEIAYEQYKYQTLKGMKDLRTAIEELEAEMELQFIYAPYDGEVYIDDKMKEGTKINQDTGLIYMNDIKSAVLGASVNEISKLWYQMDVSVTGIYNMKEDTTNIHPGKILAVDSLFNGKANTGMIYIGLEDKDDILSTMHKANITANCVTVEQVIVIPVSVVKNEKDMRYVYILDKDGVVRKQYITGRDNGSDMWVYSGLSEGQQIVVE